MTSLSALYSGVVINQNATPTAMYPWTSFGGYYLYQTFTLPADYQRGVTEGETNIPDISGFQFYVQIDQGFAQSAALDYLLEYYDNGWITLAQGTQVGSHTDGLCWFDIILPNSVAITTDMLKSMFHIGIRARDISGREIGLPVTLSEDGQYIINGVGYSANLVSGVPYPISVGGLPAYLLSNSGQITWGIQQGISAIGYVEPTPLAGQAISQGEVFQADQLTPLAGAHTTASLSFRLLSLVADSGTDFLGNPYRSAVVSHSISNTAGTATSVGNGSSTAGINSFQSPPMPSRFAVIPTYWDVRPVPENPSYGLINLVSDPSFEYDPEGGTSSQWSGFGGESIVSSTWSTSGSQSLNYQWTNTDGSSDFPGIYSVDLPVQGNTSYYVQCDYNFVNFTGAAGLTIGILWKDVNGDEITNPSVDTASRPTSGIGTLGGSIVSPDNAATAQIQLYMDSSTIGDHIDMFFDSIMLVASTSTPAYFDGDTVGAEWVGQVGQSASVQVIQPSVQDNTVVIDSILVDPITPNMAFNVYYSTDDQGNRDDMTMMTDSDWESKMWTRVPEVYLCTQRQEYALPSPIVAKYVCVEFTNLQSQSYDPGPFQQPVSYKKFPTWVANFFVAEMEMPSFVVDQVNVQYDALDFMYNYYLDDLHQEPDSPVAAPKDAASQLTTYFNSNTGTTGIDATTLSQINLVMNRFTQTPDNNVDPTSLLGSYVQNLYATNTPTLTVESGTLSPIDYSGVSSLEREPVIFEQSLPVMFFFVPCRHGYKQLQATFDRNRAYFCGVNQISFLREHYTVAADTQLYIESGGDLQNAKLNDFVLGQDGSWYASLGNSE